tara:strand:- start:141 stop:1097 length:957 start_codon:yes stop_codon:yes gene_type:complete
LNIKSSIIENKYLKIKTLNIGASLYEVNFNKQNLILNLGSIKNYKTKHPFVGSTCGRYANRISKGQFFIKGIKYKLIRNENSNTIHGGKKGFDKIIWKIQEHSKEKIVYSLKSKHLDQGFPGNLRVFCEYMLKKNELVLSYYFKSDKYTYVNLTNHSYWNFNRKKKIKIFNHDLKINSSYYLPVNNQNIPLGNKKKVFNNDYDFRKFSNLGNKTSYGNKPYDINYITGIKKKHFVACLISRTSKVKMKIFSNQPGLQLYTGHKLNFKSKQKKLSNFQGVCLETQHFPNSPNQKNFPSTLVLPNKNYKLFTIYKFEKLL